MVSQQLGSLESEGIDILREAAASFGRPALERGGVPVDRVRVAAMGRGKAGGAV